MTNTREIKIGQVWERKRDGVRIQIMAERTDSLGNHRDDWFWQRAEGRPGPLRPCYGLFIRRDYEFVTELVRVAEL